MKKHLSKEEKKQRERFFEIAFIVEVMFALMCTVFIIAGLKDFVMAIRNKEINDAIQGVLLIVIPCLVVYGVDYLRKYLKNKK